MVAGFVPSTVDTVSEYTPTIREVLIALGIYGLGALLLTVLFRVAIVGRKSKAL